MSKTKAILFFKACQTKLARYIAETRLKIGRKVVFFNKEAILWLGIWLDRQLNFASHINKRLKMVKAMEIMIKQPSKAQKLC